MSARGLTRVPVVVERGRDVWQLVYTEPCAGCGSLHRHGGGSLSDPAPTDPGTRIVHCPSYHRRFRDDCKRAKGSPYCSVAHLPPTTVVELYIVEPSA